MPDESDEGSATEDSTEPQPSSPEPSESDTEDLPQDDDMPGGDSGNADSSNTDPDASVSSEGDSDSSSVTDDETADEDTASSDGEDADADDSNQDGDDAADEPTEDGSPEEPAESSESEDSDESEAESDDESSDSDTGGDGLTKTDDDGGHAEDTFEDVPLEERPRFGPRLPREERGDDGRDRQSSDDRDRGAESVAATNADDSDDDESADSDGDGSEDDDGSDNVGEEGDDETDDVGEEGDDETGTDDDDGDLESPKRHEADEEAEPPRAKTDGDGFGSAHDPERQEPTYPNPDEDIGGISTPPDDQEMPLADHIEEMVLRLAVVLLIGAAATAIALLWASQAIEFIWFNIFPGPTAEVPPPHVYHPLELWLTRIKVAALAGIMVSLPMFVYECYLFMRPGLYPHERKYYLAAVPTSVVLGAIGMLVSFVVVLPILFRYFTFYSEGSAEIAYALGETFNLVITLTGFLAIVFQIPLFIILAVMMGVTTRRWLADKRIYFWAAFAGLSFMFTFDPTLMAPIIVAIIMIILFEGTLLLLKWVGR